MARDSSTGGMEENSLNRHGTGEILGILRLRLSRTAPSASLRMTRGKKSLKRKEPQPFAGKFKLHDFVVMPDHFHVLLTVDGNTIIEGAIQLIKGGYSFRRNKELGWQQRSGRRIFRSPGTGPKELPGIRSILMRTR